MTGIFVLLTHVAWLIFALTGFFSKKIRLITAPLLLGSLFIWADINANITGIFEIKPLHKIELDLEVKKVLATYDFPEPEITINRFLKDSVIVSNSKIVLPANYVSFDKFQMNYIMLLYIESNSLKKEKITEIETNAKKAEKNNKKSLIALEPEKLKKTRTQSDIYEIMKKGGETECFLSFSEFREKCTFTSLENLNLSRDGFISKSQFENNVTNHFEMVVSRAMDGKNYTKYASFKHTYNVADISALSMSWK